VTTVITAAANVVRKLIVAEPEICRAASAVPNTIHDGSVRLPA
jgi:hypothetical protein